MTSTSSAASECRFDDRLDDGLEELRAAFVVKLQSDRLQFVALSAALAGAEDDAACIFLDLRDRAHKIRGAAAVFEISELAAAARALEIAAIAAGDAHAGNNDAKVCDALVALVRLMGDADEAMAHGRKVASNAPQRAPKLVS